MFSNIFVSMINLERALRYWLGCVCHCNLTYHFLYRYWPTVWGALPLLLPVDCNAANIGSEGLYEALRVWFGIGLKASWLDQTVYSRLGLCLFDQRAIWNGSYKELRVFACFMWLWKHLIRCFHAHFFARSCIFEAARRIRILLCNSEVYNEAK